MNSSGSTCKGLRRTFLLLTHHYVSQSKHRKTFHISETSKWLVSPFERSDSLQNTFGKHEADETDFFLSQVWLVSLRHVIIVLNVPAKHIVMEKVIMDIQRTNDILLVGWLVVSRKETFRNAHGSWRGKQGQDNSAFKSYQSQLTTCLLNLNLYSGDIFWEQTD